VLWFAYQIDMIFILYFLECEYPEDLELPGICMLFLFEGSLDAPAFCAIASVHHFCIDSIVFVLP